MRRFVVSAFVTFSLFSSNFVPLSVGSETAVSRETTIPSFPAAASDNTVLGFAWLESGFSLESASTTCTFNGQFPVSGRINLTGGKLFLQRDLRFTNTARLETMGSIDGQDHFVELSPSMTQMEVGFTPGTDITVTYSFNLTTDVNSVDWSPDGQYIVTGIDNVGDNHEMKIFYFDGVTLTLTASTNLGSGSALHVNNVRWHPFDQRYIALAKQDAGSNEPNDFSVYFFDDLTRTVTRIFGIEDINMFAVAWHPTGSYIALARDAGGGLPELQMYNFLNAAVTLSSAADIPGGNRNVSSEAFNWDSTGSYIVVGTEDNGAEADLFVYHLAGDGTFTLTFSVNTLETVNSADWMPSNSFIAVGLEGGTEKLRVYFFDSNIGIVTEKEAARVGEVTSVNSVNWSFDGNQLVVGKDTTTGNDLIIYNFNTTTFVLTENKAHDITDVSGDFIDSVRFSPNKAFIAVGDEAEHLTVFSGIVDAASAAPSTLENVTLMYNAQLNLSVELQFARSCTIDGHGNELVFNDGGAIKLRDGALLCLKNMTLSNVSASRLACLTSNASIVLSNCVLNLASDVTFTQGSLLFDRDVVIRGSVKFSYESTIGSTIASHSTLYIDRGITLSYSPASANTDLLIMTDSTSQLFFNGATLHATTTGLELTRGTVLVDGRSLFSSEGLTSLTGIILGDGVSSDNNVRIIERPDAQLVLDGGFILDRTV